MFKRLRKVGPADVVGDEEASFLETHLTREGIKNGVILTSLLPARIAVHHHFLRIRILPKIKIKKDKKPKTVEQL